MVGKIVILASCMILSFIIFFSTAGATIVGSGHDLTASGPGKFRGSSNEVCIYCHTPHGGVSQDRYGNRVALWNRSLNEGYAYTMYSSATFTGTIADKPTGNTLLCLSCHDGVTTDEPINGAKLSNVINYSSAPITMVYPSPSFIGAVSYPAYENINIGLDLSNDHPVSFVYDHDLSVRDPGVKDPTPDNLGALKLYYGRLECGTCHDPHEYGTSSNGKRPFLRMSNASSAMCFQCHIK